MADKVSGHITHVLDLKSGVSATSGNTWAKQTYVMQIQTGGEFEKHICFDVWGKERIEAFNLNVGDIVTISIDIKAREYNGRWYNDVSAWKCERGNSSGIVAPTAPSPQPVPVAPTIAPAAPKFDAQPQPGDDLPF